MKTGLSGAADVPGCPDHSEPFWLNKDSDRLWRGSHKGKDWKHLVRRTPLVLLSMYFLPQGMHRGAVRL
jgi:hypothetical protein